LQGQVGPILPISKERVRRMQARAFESLRAAAGAKGLADLLPSGA
jgi:DNA-directed RNA polymerase sigma subunit (sigma70/sigma32)